MNCRYCKGSRHRAANGRFVSLDPACPYTQTASYQHAKRMFYEELERMTAPLRYFRDEHGNLVNEQPGPDFGPAPFLGKVPE